MTSRIDHNNPKASGAFGLPYHYEMLADRQRVTPFAEAIKATCQDKIVLESGTGSGIFSILAAQAGAKHVFAVEIDPQIAQFARRNIQQSGYSDRITLLEKDIMKVISADLQGQKADVVIAENLSTWQVTEPQLIIMNYINQHLAKPSAIRLPEIIFNQLELTQATYRFANLIDLKTYYFEFSGIEKAIPLSEKITVETLELSQIQKLDFQHKLTVTAQNSGVFNSIRLTSPLQVYQQHVFTSSDSLMPPVVFPLEGDIIVRAGDQIELHIKYQKHSSWEGFLAKARLLK